ncbi:MAG TPA: molybdenum cofactor biosynthesis protein B [Polyangiaceae bacterium]|nr:molybdenum cofactor biosynthesis protein B [Polyangiaceae bacterium]
MAGHAASDPDSQARAAEARRAIRILTVTVSDTRTSGTDESGPKLRALLAAAGFTLAEHRIVKDEPALIAAVVRAVSAHDLADVLVTTGGTGIAPRDCTIEAIGPLLEKTLDGFGEAFRRLSWDDVGPRSVLSRAIAGVAGGRVVVALPGSPRAVALAVEKLLAPLLEHAVALCRGETGGHGHGKHGR